MTTSLVYAVGSRTSGVEDRACRYSASSLATQMASILVIKFLLRLSFSVGAASVGPSLLVNS